MAEPTKLKSKLLKIEKHLLRLGALLAVIATVVFLIDSGLFKPSPADLDVTFFLSETDELNFARDVYEPKDRLSEPFPLGLTIYNRGETTAEDIILRLIRVGMIENITFNGLEVEEEKEVKLDEGFRSSYKIKLGRLNPGDKLFLDKNIWCQVGSFTQDRRLELHNLNRSLF